MNKERFYALLTCQIAISGILMNNKGKHFKIGKTAQNPPSDRIGKEYKQKYSKFLPIYGSADLALIDDLEVELITYYMRCYNASCDNKLPEIGPRLKGTNMGYIYLALE